MVRGREGGKASRRREKEKRWNAVGELDLLSQREASFGRERGERAPPSGHFGDWQQKDKNSIAHRWRERKRERKQMGEMRDGGRMMERR